MEGGLERRIFACAKMRLFFRTNNENIGLWKLLEMFWNVCESHGLIHLSVTMASVCPGPGGNSGGNWSIERIFLYNRRFYETKETLCLY